MKYCKWHLQVELVSKEKLAIKTCVPIKELFSIQRAKTNWTAKQNSYETLSASSRVEHAVVDFDIWNRSCLKTMPECMCAFLCVLTILIWLYTTNLKFIQVPKLNSKKTKYAKIRRVVPPKD